MWSGCDFSELGDSTIVLDRCHFELPQRVVMEFKISFYRGSIHVSHESTFTFRIWILFLELVINTIKLKKV